MRSISNHFQGIGSNRLKNQVGGAGDLTISSRPFSRHVHVHHIMFDVDGTDTTEDGDGEDPAAKLKDNDSADVEEVEATT